MFGEASRVRGLDMGIWGGNRTLTDDTGQSWLQLRQALTSPGAAGSQPASTRCVLGAGGGGLAPASHCGFRSSGSQSQGSPVVSLAGPV